MKIDFKNLKLDVRYLDINLTKPFARNPRTHSKEHIQQIATSIMKFSWIKNSFALSRARLPAPTRMDGLWQHGIRVQGTARMHIVRQEP